MSTQIFLLLTMRRVAIIFFELGVNRKTLHDYFLVKKFCLIATVLYINRISETCFTKNALKKPTCKWACSLNFKQLYHSRTLSPSFKLTYISLTQSYKAEAIAQRCSVKKMLLEISQNSQENTCARFSRLQLY